MRDSQLKRVLGISEALAISIITGIAYCVVFAIDIGAAGERGVPGDYVHVSAEQVIGLAVFAIVALAAFGAPLHLSTASGTIRVLSVLRLRNVFLAVYLLALTGILLMMNYVRPFDLKQFVIAALAGAIPGVLVGAVATRQRDKINRWGASLSAWVVASWLSFVALAFTLVFAWAAAVASVRMQSVFSVVDTPEYRGYAVVWTSGDLVFLERYDLVTHTIGSEMEVMRIGAPRPLQWHLRDLGRLRSIGSVWLQSP